MKKFYILLVALLIVTGAMAQWFPQYSGIEKNLNSVFFTDTITGYAVGDTGTILKTSDGGTNWSILNSGIYENLLSVYFTDANTGYIVGNDSVIYKTIDGGQNWIGLSAGISVSLNSVFFTGADTGYITGNFYDPNTSLNQYILKTTNGGNLWTISYYGTGPGGGGPFLKAIHFPNANTGYAVGEQSQLPYPFVLKTTNGGTNWTTQNAGQNHFLSRSVYFINSDVGFIVNPLLKTTNGGTDWTIPILSDSFFLNDIYFSDINTGYGVGDNGIILKTDDSGTTWVNQISGIASDLTSICFIDANTGYVVGKGGTILKTTNGGIVGLNESAIVSIFLKLYPNPAKNNIMIESFITGDTHLSILNVDSQEIMERQVNDHKTQIDVSYLPSGVYFVKMKNKNIVEVRKFIKE